jgi:glycosyltransferase involved in cell wall biosynthesis
LKLSVLMPVYHKESSTYFRQCLESLAFQALPADEIVIVEDGPLGEPLDAIIAAYKNDLPIVSLALPTHVGTGSALRAGLSICRGEYVARMDSDDISFRERFQRQVKFLDSNQEVDLVGSSIEEFGGNSNLPRAIRRLPASGQELLRFAQLRNPLNHMTTMFRKDSVLAAGSYQPFPGFEDYHLWARMLMHGHRLHNMKETFVYVRCDNGMQSRRGGLAYLKQDVAFQLFLHKMGLVTASGCIRNIAMRAPVRLAPAFVRSIFYNLFLRDGQSPSGELEHG